MCVCVCVCVIHLMCVNEYKIIYIYVCKCVRRNFLSFLLRCSTRPYEWGTQ